MLLPEPGSNKQVLQTSIFPTSLFFFDHLPRRAVGALSLESRMGQGQPTAPPPRNPTPAPIVCQADRAETRQ